MSQDLLLDIDDGIALITLNRPGAYNAMNPAIISGLGDAYRQCDEDDNVRVVVVTGAGNVFCTGADMSAGGDTFDSGAQTVEVNSLPLSTQAWDVRKPVIAACNGHAVGAGLGLAVQADMRVFADEGKYGFLQSRRGVVTDFAMEYVLPRLVGFETAFEMLVRASRYTGQEAAALGLAGRSVPADRVLETAMEIARDIATHCAPLPVGLHKALMYRGLDMPLEQLAELENRALNHTMTKPDAIKGGMAYIERRPPNWCGSVREDWPDWM